MDMAKDSRSFGNMLRMIDSALVSMPEDCDSNPSPLSPNPSPLFVTKYASHKLGFGFELSDHSIGVLFNNSTRMCVSADKTCLEFEDENKKTMKYSVPDIPDSLSKPFKYLKYFTRYMDENLVQAGKFSSEVLSSEDRKNFPYIKKNFSSSRAMIMHLSTGTLQINFFEDHSKIVISVDGTVIYINQNRNVSTYSLAAIGQQGCKSSIRTRLQYAASVLRDKFCLNSA